MRLVTRDKGSPDTRDYDSGHLFVADRLYPDLANLPRDCLIARKLFLLDSSRREQVLNEDNWTHTKET